MKRTVLAVLAAALLMGGCSAALPEATAATIPASQTVTAGASCVGAFTDAEQEMKTLNSAGTFQNTALDEMRQAAQAAVALDYTSATAMLQQAKADIQSATGLIGQATDGLAAYKSAKAACLSGH